MKWFATAGDDEVKGRRRALPAVVMGMVLLLGACNEAGESGSDGSGDDGGATAQELSIAIGAEPRTLDLLTAEDGQRELFQFSVYEPLAFRNTENMEELEPVLAESWESDGNVWTFQLRDGVTFHDGSEFTAEDVVGTFDRLLSKGSELGGSRAAGVTDVRAVDDLRVEIETGAPDPTIPAKVALIGIIPSELSDPKDDTLASEMVGTGPYRFVSWDRGQQIVLEANEDHWAETPQLKDLTIRFLEEDATRLSALEADELDIALKMPSEFESQAPNVVTAASPDVYTLFFNTIAGGPLEDQRLREAVNYAIDRQALIDQLLGGHGEQVKGQFVGQYVFGSTPNLEEFPYDLERAQQLVQEASGGTAPTVSLSAPTGRWPKDREMGQAIAGMLEEAGFKVDLQLPELSAWLEGLVGPAEQGADMWLAGHGNDIFDMERSVAWVSCGEALSHYCNREVLDLVEDARTTLDEEQRLRLYEQMWEIVHEDAAYASISTIDQVHFTQENVQWTPRPDYFILFHEISL